MSTSTNRNVPAPAISHVHPDYLTRPAVPHTIVGENFDAPHLELWTWAPPRDDDTILGELPRLHDPAAAPPLPATPPQDAVRIEPLDVESQVLVARLTGNVLWARTDAGWSAPYLLNIARPFWCSCEAVRAGEMVHVFGMGLRPDYRMLYGFKGPTEGIGRLALANDQGTHLLEELYEGRSTQWVTTPHLIYARIPRSTPPGDYALHIHNGQGGQHGWVRVGALRVGPTEQAQPIVLNARDFGATGDGLTDDSDALEAALAQAHALLPQTVTSEADRMPKPTDCVGGIPSHTSGSRTPEDPTDAVGGLGKDMSANPQDPPADSTDTSLRSQDPSASFPDTPAASHRAPASAETTPASAIIHLPPGTYRITRTLRLPRGVTLRGADRENTIVRGDGYDSASDEPPAAVLALTDRTALSALTVTGAVATGVPSTRCERSDMSADALIRLLPASEGGVVEDVSILDCRLRALSEPPGGGALWYTKAIHVGHDTFGRCRRVRIHECEIFGSLFFYRGERMEIVGNTWRDTTGTILVSIHGWAVDSLLDANRFVDTPGRLCFYPVRHCCIRFNEIHGAFRGTWTNAEEVYLVHGSYGHYFGEEEPRTVGTVASATPRTLTDSAVAWKPGLLADCTVLITAGRGFGQYRRVLSNTPDTLTLDRPWRVEPDGTSEYVVARMYTDNVFYANLNSTPLRMSLWLDTIGTLVEMHRDEFSKGMDIWGGDWTRPNDPDSPRGWGRGMLPAYYNLVLNGWMDGALGHLYAEARSDSPLRGVPAFANAWVHCKIRQPHMARTGFDRRVVMHGGLQVGNPLFLYESPRRKRQAHKHSDRPAPTGRTAASHTLLADNLLSFTPVGILIAENARKTFVLDTLFQEVREHVVDLGTDTIIRGSIEFGLEGRGSDARFGWTQSDEAGETPA